ncbi:MAG: tripartite tricarboxylate transporter TctB family protein [Alcanivorax sp.]
MKARVLDLCYGAAALAAALAVYLAGGGNDRPVPVASNPYWYPKLLLALIGVCAVWLMVRAALNGGPDTPPERLRWRSLTGTVVISGAYLLGYEWLGFLPATLALMLVFSLFQGFRRPLWLVGVAVLFTALVWYGFADLLNRPPPGPTLPSLSALFS